MSGGRHTTHLSPADFDALDQFRLRHGLLRKGLMDVQGLLKSRRKAKVREAIELIEKVLNTDKGI